MISYSSGLVKRLLGLATASGDVVTVGGPNGLQGLTKLGVISIFSGAAPTSADAAATGTLLGQVTVAGVAYVVSTGANGLTLDNPTNTRTISKPSGVVWTLKGSAPGTAGWFRYNGFNAAGDTNATDSSAAYVRIDGSCGITSGDLRLTSVTIAIGSTATIDTFTITVA